MFFRSLCNFWSLEFRSLMFNIQLSDLTILLLVRENAVPEKKCGHPGDLSPDWCRQEWHPPSPLVVSEYPTYRKPDTACSKKAMITMYQTCSELSQILSPDLIVVSKNYKRIWAAAILTSLQVEVRTATEPAALGVFKLCRFLKQHQGLQTTDASCAGVLPSSIKVERPGPLDRHEP